MHNISFTIILICPRVVKPVRGLGPMIVRLGAKIKDSLARRLSGSLCQGGQGAQRASATQHTLANASVGLDATLLQRVIVVYVGARASPFTSAYYISAWIHRPGASLAQLRIIIV